MKLDNVPPALRQRILKQIALEDAKLIVRHAPQNRSPLPNPEPQHHQTPALGATAQGKTESLPSTVVSFTGYRVRPLDPDNFAGSVKDLLDGLRHAGIISGDEPWRITLKTNQVAVKHFAEEKNVIEIDSV